MAGKNEISILTISSHTPKVVFSKYSTEILKTLVTDEKKRKVK